MARAQVSHTLPPISHQPGPHAVINCHEEGKSTGIQSKSPFPLSQESRWLPIIANPEEV